MTTNPGPLARFKEIAADPQTMGVIVQRITDAETPESLKAIAKAWQVPLGKLAEWITEDSERAGQYANALRIAGEQRALEVIEIADSATPENVGVKKLQVEARKWYAGKLARDRFGEMNEVRVTGQVGLVAILSGMPRPGRTFEHDEPAALAGKDVKVLGQVTPAEKIPAQPAEVLTI